MNEAMNTGLCTRIQLELVAFHFGAIEPELRAEKEQHLPLCPTCLAEFLALKRAIETAESDLGPSRAAHDRLRRAMAQKLQPIPIPHAVTSRAGSWWERPVAFLVASAAVDVVASSAGSPPVTMVSPPAATRTR